MKKSSKSYIVFIILITVFISFLITGCEYRAMWMSNNIGNQFKASYKTFTGDEVMKINLQQGETILIDYDVEVTKGSLTIEIQSPDNESLWTKTFEENQKDKVEIDVKEDGKYKVIIIGAKTSGKFNVSWDKKEK